MSTIIKSLASLGTIVAGGFSAISAWPIMSGKLGFDPRNSYLNTVALTYSLVKHYWIGKLDSDIRPAAVIAGIPLPSIEELSHGISDREVRYRANGGVFLAHQSGGNESLRIVGRAWGDSRFLFLNMLDLLFLWGSATTIDVYKAAVVSGANVSSIAIANQLSPRAKRVEGITEDPWEVFNSKNLNQGYEEQHMTFPVLTKNRVYLSMYIETYSWRQTLDKHGRKMVEYTIFFRKYEPAPEIEYSYLQIPRKNGTVKSVAVYRENTTNRPLIYSAWKAVTEVSATLSLHPEAFNITNIGDFFSQFVMNYFGVNAKDGTIPGIIEQRGFF